jgi:hypothetical protein
MSPSDRSSNVARDLNTIEQSSSRESRRRRPIIQRRLSKAAQHVASSDGEAGAPRNAKNATCRSKPRTCTVRAVIPGATHLTRSRSTGEPSELNRTRKLKIVWLLSACFQRGRLDRVYASHSHFNEWSLRMDIGSELRIGVERAARFRLAHRSAKRMGCSRRGVA